MGRFRPPPSDVPGRTVPNRDRRTRFTHESATDTFRPIRPAERIAFPEFLGGLGHGDELDPVERGPAVQQSLEHEKHLRPPGHIRMQGQRDDGVVLLAAHPIELIVPHLFDIPRVDEVVRVGMLLDEHHGWQVVEVPVTTEFDQIDFPAGFERPHPVRGRFGGVDGRPSVTDPGVKGDEVVVVLGMVVGEAELGEDRGGVPAQLPPRRDMAAGRRPQSRSMSSTLFDMTSCSCAKVRERGF